MDLNMRDYPGLSRWALNESKSVLKRGWGAKEEGSNVTTEATCHTADFQDGRRCHEPRNVALGAGKDKETDCPLEPPEGVQPRPHLFLDPSGTN